MDAMSLPGGDNPVVWLILLAVLFLAIGRARTRGDDHIESGTGRLLRLGDLILSGPDRSSFRYRRGR